MVSFRPNDRARAHICVVGAGPAGVAAARALALAGYRQITVLEAAATAGGKCHSGVIGGRSYDLGAVTLFDGYVRTLRLAQEAGVSLAELETWSLAEGARRELPADGPTAIAWYEALLAKFPGLLDGPLEDFGKARALGLAEPYGAWAERVGLAPIAPFNLHLYQSTGYGYLGDPIAALYFLRARVTCSGRSYQIVEGFQQLWQRLAAQLEARGAARFLMGQAVEGVVPGPGAGLTVRTRDGAHQADAVIWTAGPRPALSALPLTEDQRQILQGMRFLDYRSWAIEAEGLTEHPRRMVMLAENNRSERRGHLTLYARPHADRPIYLGWQYSTDADDDEHERVLRADLAGLGAEAGRVRLRQRWPEFFPHFSTAALERGDPERLEASQGTGNLYFAGAMLSMELVEHAVAHAETLVERCFA